MPSWSTEYMLSWVCAVSLPSWASTLSDRYWAATRYYPFCPWTAFSVSIAPTRLCVSMAYHLMAIDIGGVPIPLSQPVAPQTKRRESLWFLFCFFFFNRVTFFVSNKKIYYEKNKIKNIKNLFQKKKKMGTVQKLSYR